MRIHCSQHYKPQEYTHLNWDTVKPTEKGEIFWHLVNFTPDMDKYKTILAFNKAFDIWQEAFDAIAPQGRVIRLISTDDWHQAHIRMYFMNPHTREQTYTISDGSQYTLVNHWPFTDGSGGVLAHRPPNKNELHFDEAEHWSELSKPGHIRLLAVVIHELGHIWDLGHSTVHKSTMRPYYDSEVIYLSEDDFEGLAAKWTPTKLKLSGKDVLLADNKGCLI